MAYILDTTDVSLSEIFNDENIVKFIEDSVNIASNLEVGNYEKLIYNDGIFSIAQNTWLKDRSECVFESHKNYIDVHIVVDGAEKVALCNVKQVSTPYEENIKNDYYLYDMDLDGEIVVLDKNTMGIFLYEDVHMTGINLSNVNDNVVKVVLKINKTNFDKEYIYG